MHRAICLTSLLLLSGCTAPATVDIFALVVVALCWGAYTVWSLHPEPKVS